MALELAICTPVLIVMLLVVVALGRVTHGRQLVQDAAASAARAASLTATSVQARQAATTAATASLSQAGMACTAAAVTVDTSAFHAGGQVAVTVECRSDLNRLSLTGLPGQIHLDATSTTPIDPLRDLA